MNSESLSTTLKTCNACKRKLPVNYFGLRKFSSDGYNPCCKECRNFRRRKAYQSPNDSGDPIFPLAEHNKHFMWTLPDEIKKETLIGLELKTLEPAHVIYQKKNRNVYWLTVYIANGAGYTHVHTGDKAGFIDFVLPLLNRLQVRLFHPKDAIALSNWGLVNQ